MRAHIRSHEAQDLYGMMQLAREVENEIEICGKKMTMSGSFFPSYGLRARAGSIWDITRSEDGVLRHSITASRPGAPRPPILGPALNANRRVYSSTGSKVDSATSSHHNSASSNLVTSHSKLNRKTRQYTQKEFQDLRAKGLCFRCHQPFHPLHQWPNKTFRALILGEEEEQDPSNISTSESGDFLSTLEDGAPQILQMELPCFAMTSNWKISTMKIMGSINASPVIIMIDSGASHCFISPTLVARLNLPNSMTPAFGVKLGDDHCRETHGVCRNTAISMPSISVTVDCYLFPLGGVDVILEISWLQTLGDVKVNWSKMTMAIAHNGDYMQIVGDPSLSNSSISCYSLHRLYDIEFTALLWSSVLGEVNSTIATSTVFFCRFASIA
ncbi:Acid proteases protein [Dioscorea alata]|uniref:Acid proteases protein n=1 Tax=Dioscorea alata TaxID=55571 RepID=A0ACB7W291_DIOAL|nr:Acid proteases protein [Dioscorea alata]